MKCKKAKRKTNLKRYKKTYEEYIGREFTISEMKFFIFITDEKAKNHKFIRYALINPDINTTHELINTYYRMITYRGNKTSSSNLEYLTLIHGKEAGYQSVKDHSERATGANNPGYQHGGRLSPFSKKFIKGDVRKETIEKANITKQENPHKNPVHRDYFLQFTNANYDLADYLLKERQAVGRKDKFIERYGEGEGLKRWQERQRKWLKSYKKTNFSKISQEMFWGIVDEFGTDGVQFAQLKSCVAYFDGSNNEKTIKSSKSYVKADFIYNNKIIEFDGDYWHGRQGNIKRDKERDICIMSLGYDILHIKEHAYMKDRQKEIKRCLGFLGEA